MAMLGYHQTLEILQLFLKIKIFNDINNIQQ